MVALRAHRLCHRRGVVPLVRSHHDAAFITNADVIRKILAWLRLPLDAPPLVQARDSPHVVPAW